MAWASVAVCPSPKSHRLNNHVVGEGASENGGDVLKVTAKGAEPAVGEAMAMAGQPPKLLAHCAKAQAEKSKTQRDVNKALMRGSGLPTWL